MAGQENSVKASAPIAPTRVASNPTAVPFSSCANSPPSLQLTRSIHGYRSCPAAHILLAGCLRLLPNLALLHRQIYPSMVISATRWVDPLARWAHGVSLAAC